LFILREVKHAKVTSKFATPLSVEFLLYKGFHSKAPLYDTVLHIHGQKYTLQLCTKPSVKVHFMFTHKTTIIYICRMQLMNWTVCLGHQETAMKLNAL